MLGCIHPATNTVAPYSGVANIALTGRFTQLFPGKSKMLHSSVLLIANLSTAHRGPLLASTTKTLNEMPQKTSMKHHKNPQRAVYSLVKVLVRSYSIKRGDSPCRLKMKQSSKNNGSYARFAMFVN
ncbi:MAG: hypothetical protein WC946_10945 [Bacteroidales bacterium]